MKTTKKSFNIFTSIIAFVVSFVLMIGGLSVVVNLLENPLNRSGAGALAILIAFGAAFIAFIIWVVITVVLRAALIAAYKKKRG